MKPARSGDELAILAMEKEISRLSAAAEKYKAEADEVCDIVSEFIAIDNEVNAVINSGKSAIDVHKSLDSLQKRQERANRVIGKDLMTILNKQYLAETERDNLGMVLSGLRFRFEMRMKK